MSAQLYPKEARYHIAALHAAELALNYQRLDQAVALANVVPDVATDKIARDANLLKGTAYLQNKSFVDAETIFSDFSIESRVYPPEFPRLFIKKSQSTARNSIEVQTKFKATNNIQIATAN